MTSSLSREGDDCTREPALVRSSSRQIKKQTAKKSSHNQHQEPYIVSHAYVDHLNDAIQEEPSSSRIGVKLAFPFKLHTMLRTAASEGFDHVVSWQEHGRAFRVHDREAFIQTIMPLFFQQTKMTSFNRQLCLYGFVRLTAVGADRGAYYHELCIRGRPDLLSLLHRTRVKGTGKKAASSPQTEPDFYRMPPCPDIALPRAMPSSPQPEPFDESLFFPSSVVTPNPSPRRTMSTVDCLSPAMIPHLPPLPTTAQEAPGKHFAEEPGPIEAFLDTNEFRFAWDDVEV